MRSKSAETLRGDALRDLGLLALPAGELGGIALVQLAEPRALLGELLLGLVVSFKGGESLLFGGGDLRLDGVDLLEERAILALGADPVDLLLVFLELFLRVLGHRLGRPPLPGGLFERMLQGIDLTLACYMLIVELPHPVRDTVQPLLGFLEVREIAL
jgi:hypothetical protein